MTHTTVLRFQPDAMTPAQLAAVSYRWRLTNVNSARIDAAAKHL